MRAQALPPRYGGATPDGHRRRARALALAAGHFLLWLGVLYAGADHPPPPGFLWLVALDLVASLGGARGSGLDLCLRGRS